MTSAVTLLGPQRRPTVDRVVQALGVTGRIATITAGWQERESDDAELGALLDGRGVNLRLHARWMQVLEEDPEYAKAEREHLVVLEELQELYLVQLDHALRATAEVAARADGHPRTTAMALDDALAIVRQIDATHLSRVRELQAAFRDAWRLQERGAIGKHAEEVRDALAECDCLVVAGGHVGVLLRVLQLFAIEPHIPAQVVAWSAGAMALTERVVLFHDRAAHGPAQTEVFDEGLGLVPGRVMLPHARRRLRTDDPVRKSVLARRFAPATCLVLDDGVSVDLGAGGVLPANARLVDGDGRIVEAGAA
ncbi:MAG: hypothetical protein QOE77_4073 [Blastocatellia bacterium]|nr:hypothetical protein [Blastocatellia bacterium]